MQRQKRLVWRWSNSEVTFQEATGARSSINGRLSTNEELESGIKNGDLELRKKYWIAQTGNYTAQYYGYKKETQSGTSFINVDTLNTGSAKIGKDDRYKKAYTACLVLE